MENPMTWGIVKKTIERAIAKHDKDVSNNICGLSLVSVIYNELYQSKLCAEDTLE
jgi:hypothetical protein